MNEYLTPAEVARIIHSTVFHVRNLIKSGVLPATRPGKRNLRVSTVDLTAFLDQQKVGGSRS